MEETVSLVSVLVPLRDESKFIDKLFSSLDWIPKSDRYIILDPSGGSEMKRIAEQHAGNVMVRAYDFSASQKNTALELFIFNTPWILLLDADEEVPDTLADEIMETVSDTDLDGYYIGRKNMVGGKWIRHGDWYPDFNIRLFRTGLGRFEKRRVHAELMVEGRIGFLKEEIVHYCLENPEDRRKDIEKYARLKAQDAFTGNRSLSRLSLRRFPGALRLPLQMVWFLSPPFFRSVLLFLYLYFLKFGFLDGKVGFRLAVAEGADPLLSYKYFRQLIRRAKGPSIPGIWARLFLRRIGQSYLRLKLAPKAAISSPPDLKKVKSILVVHLFGMGDVVMALPFFNRLKKYFPGAKVTAAVRPESAAILNMVRNLDEEHNFPDRVISVNGKKPFQKKDRKSFDLVLLPFTGLTNYLTIRKLGKGKAVAGYISGTAVETNYRVDSRPSDRGWNHPSDKAMDLLHTFGFRESGYVPDTDNPTLKLPSEVVNPVDLILQDASYAVLHVGGLSFSRRIPIRKLAVAADYLLQRTEMEVVITGDWRDRIDAELLDERMDGRLVNMAGLTTVEEFAAILGSESCRFIVTGDTSAMHIASAFEKPVVAMFGSTSPSTRLPYGFRGEILRADRPCAPCFTGEHEPVCRVGEPCLMAVADNLIIEAVKRIMGEEYDS